MRKETTNQILIFTVFGITLELIIIAMFYYFNAAQSDLLNPGLSSREAVRVATDYANSFNQLWIVSLIYLFIFSTVITWRNNNPAYLFLTAVFGFAAQYYSSILGSNLHEFQIANHLLKSDSNIVGLFMFGIVSALFKWFFAFVVFIGLSLYVGLIFLIKHFAYKQK